LWTHVRAPRPRPRSHLSFASTLKSIVNSGAGLVGFGAGAAYGLAARIVIATNHNRSNSFGVMTIGFLFVIPIVIGFLTIRPMHELSLRMAIFATRLSCLLVVLVVLGLFVGGFDRVGATTEGLSQRGARHGRIRQRAHRHDVDPATALTVYHSIAYYQNSNIALIWIDKYVDLDLLGFQVPVSWFNSIDPFISIAFVPIIIVMWKPQETRGGEPNEDHQDLDRRLDRKRGQPAAVHRLHH
jgi:hypothetical protein